jgi:hypothetical protein
LTMRQSQMKCGLSSYDLESTRRRRKPEKRSEILPHRHLFLATPGWPMGRVCKNAYQRRTREIKPSGRCCSISRGYCGNCQVRLRSIWSILGHTVQYTAISTYLEALVPTHQQAGPRLDVEDEIVRSGRRRAHTRNQRPASVTMGVYVQ